jgi:hypothetical protein
MTSTVGRLRLTAAEQFWYVLQCIAFGAGYFAKIPVKKALTEVTQIPGSDYAGLRSGQDIAPQLGEVYRPSAPADQSRSLPRSRSATRQDDS